MSLDYVDCQSAVNDLVQDLKWDEVLRQRFAADPEPVLAEYELSQQQLTAIRQRDLFALYQLGLHPYLLSQLARLLYGAAEQAGSSKPAMILVEALQKGEAGHSG